jgi:hypothetical protein
MYLNSVDKMAFREALNRFIVWKLSVLGNEHIQIKSPELFHSHNTYGLKTKHSHTFKTQ